MLLALAMNALIAAAKLVVGAVSGSSAMLAEGAHSVADTVNEVFLLPSLRRSSRPPDSKHPFGYGAERFFWSLLAAIGIFLSGAVFSAYQAFRALTESGSGEHSYIWSYAVLGLAFKRDTDDERDSLSHKLVRLLERELADVAIHDPMVATPTVSFEDAVSGADVVIVATNHSAYSTPEALRVIAERAGEDCLVVDPWNAFGAAQVFAYASEVEALRA